ncbi:MAG: hypothetical protein WCD76_06070 [Pyrinomonadaceae bacterium]
MKKLLALTLSLASIGFVASSARAAESSNALTVSTLAAAPQVQIQLGGGRRNNRRFNRGVRTSTQTRLVRVGRQVYRETYQVTYRPNGRTVTRLISRVRVR